MADDNGGSLNEQAQALREEVGGLMEGELNHTAFDEESIKEALNYLWMIWGDFHLTVSSPIIKTIEPPIVHQPKTNEQGLVEHVFPIVDRGFQLSTSRAGEGFKAGHSMYKFFNTVDKMIALLLERLRTGGIAPDEEVRVIFDGHELAMRKGFEAVLNLDENVLVVNYDPGKWGDRYMKNILEMVERGYGLPKQAPRSDFTNQS